MSMHGTLAADVGEARKSRLNNVSELGQRALLFFQPWRRRALLLIALIAAFCDFYQLQANGYANLYYAAAIRSMMQSWHNFFFVSYDPGGFVSVDKPPLGFWIQTISAKIFGYSGFSILLPEALAGVASVIVLYVLVRRAFGDVAGLLAALALAITPISVVTNRNNTIDSLLVLTSLLAAWAVLKATEQGSLRWLAGWRAARRSWIQYQDARSLAHPARARAGLFARRAAALAHASAASCPRWRRDAGDLAGLGRRGGPHAGE